jgi:hypothetical protein
MNVIPRYIPLSLSYDVLVERIRSWVDLVYHDNDKVIMYYPSKLEGKIVTYKGVGVTGQFNQPIVHVVFQGKRMLGLFDFYAHGQLLRPDPDPRPADCIEWHLKTSKMKAPEWLLMGCGIDGVSNLTRLCQLWHDQRSLIPSPGSELETLIRRGGAAIDYDEREGIEAAFMIEEELNRLGTSLEGLRAESIFRGEIA